MTNQQHGEMFDFLRAINTAWRLGQTYWRQADSESYAENKRADATADKYRSLCDEAAAAIAVPARTAPEAMADGGLGLGDTPPEAVRVMMEALAPGPMTEAPEVGTEYWTTNGSGVICFIWEGDGDDLFFLRTNDCFATEADARAALHSLAGGK